MSTTLEVAQRNLKNAKDEYEKLRTKHVSVVEAFSNRSADLDLAMAAEAAAKTAQDKALNDFNAGLCSETQLDKVRDAYAKARAATIKAEELQKAARAAQDFHMASEQPSADNAVRYNNKELWTAIAEAQLAACDPNFLSIVRKVIVACIKDNRPGFTGVYRQALETLFPPFSVEEHKSILAGLKEKYGAED